MFRRSLTSLSSLFLLAADAPAAPAPAPAPAEPPEPDPAAPEPAKPAEETVPYQRFAEVNDQLKQLRDELATAQGKLTTHEREGLGELERLKAELADKERAAEEAQRERDELKAAGEKATRQGWIRDAARAAKFHDPEDAVLRINDADIRTEAGAKAAVDVLTKDENLKHLIQVDEPEKPKTGTDLLQQVLERGKPASTEDGNKEDTTSVIPVDEFNKMSTDQLVALQEADPELYRRSLSAAAKAE